MDTNSEKKEKLNTQYSEIKLMQKITELSWIHIVSRFNLLEEQMQTLQNENAIQKAQIEKLEFEIELMKIMYDDLQYKKNVETSSNATAKTSKGLFNKACEKCDMRYWTEISINYNKLCTVCDSTLVDSY